MRATFRARGESFMVRVLAVWLVLAGASAAMASGEALDTKLQQLTDRLATQEARIAALEAELARVSGTAEGARLAIEKELAQPMLLLVGTGPCPEGFKRIVTRVLILTRARNPENGHLFDEAGLTYEDPPGVGDNVYRDLDFCYRPAATTGQE
jgi:hypothetical protein